MDLDLLAASRSAWKSLEALHVVGYFAEEPTAEYVALGLHPSLSYFSSRGAAMGAVGPEVTEATFYVFAPWLHRRALPAAWEKTTPERLVRARRDGVSRALRRVLGTPDVAEALDLARRVCEGLAAPGRPLYAGHAGLEWPEDDLMALWHAATLVREHRGDGHVALLTTDGLDPVEATVLDGAWSGRAGFLTRSRGWSDAQYDAARQRLTDRDWLDASGDLTEGGRAARDGLERRTDAAGIGGWQHLGLEGTRRLSDLLSPLRGSVLDSAVLPSEIAQALAG
ncbi:MAG: SCO6745 family protein [Marmoricola sp.]